MEITRPSFSDGVHDISNELYHSSSGLSRSALMQFKRSPYHYQQHYLVEHENKETTPAMIMGNAVHTLTLEPHKFDEEFAVMPKMDRRTNVGKVAYNVFQGTLRGRMAISEDDFQKAEEIAKAIRLNPLAADLIEGCLVEQSIYFAHKATGIQCKSRPDGWLGSVIIDLKTTADASFKSFQHSAFKYGYALQAGIIYESLRSIDVNMESFVFIAVEKKYPYAVGIYVLDDEALDYGVNQFNELMENYASCLEKNKWPGYSAKSLTLPKYAEYDVIESIEDEEE